MAVSQRDVRLPGGPLGSLAGQDVGLESGVIGLDEKAGDPTVVGPGPYHGHVREGGVSDPLLLPVQDEAAVLLFGRRAQRSGIATRLRFCEAEAPDLLAPG